MRYGRYRSLHARLGSLTGAPAPGAPSPGSSPCGELELAAAPRSGEDLSRIGETGGIERGLHASHRREIVSGELQRHEAVLLHADAVFSGDRATGRDARFEDLETRLLHAVELALPREEDERMEVAVAGVEHVRDPDAVSLRYLAHRAQYVGQPRARDDAVLHVVSGRQATHRRERALASSPESVAFERRRRPPKRCRAVRAADLLDARGGVVESVAQSVDLHQQNAARIEWVARADGRFDRLGRELVHELDRARYDAGS